MKKSPLIFLAVPGSLGEDIRRFSQRHIRNEGGEDDPGEEAEAPFPEEDAGEEIFKPDPSILLPVELENGEKTLDPEKLSWEMILSGMLRVIAAFSNNGAPPQGAEPKHGDLVAEPEKAGIPSGWIDYYRRFVLTVKPEIYHEFSNAAIVKAGNGEFDMALEISNVLEGLFPGSPGVLLNRALLLEDKAAALEKNGRAAEKENALALEAYENVLALDIVLPDALFNAGFFFMRLRNFARARDCFSRYVSEAEIPGEKKKQALKIIRDIESQGLDDESFAEAYDCISRGDDEKGLVKVREFIEKFPKVWNGWFLLGWALRKLGRYRDGAEAFKKAAELGGDNGDVKNETAICLMELGDLGGARKELERALREEPENTKIISNLGVLALRAGRKDEAAAFFRTVLELDPADPLAAHFLEEA